MRPVVTHTFHTQPQNRLIYNRRTTVSAQTERLYLVHILPFLQVFHVQHMADYLEEFLKARREDEMRRILRRDKNYDASTEL